jgi:hypothetical protein
MAGSSIDGPSADSKVWVTGYDFFVRWERCAPKAPGLKFAEATASPYRWGADYLTGVD